MPSEEEIFETVKTTLVDALGVEEDEVTREATLTGDLGAESIDFLDIVFRLEKNFDIKIPRGDLFPESILGDPEYVKDGVVSDKGLAELRTRMPHFSLENVAGNPKVEQLMELFTVAMLVKYVQGKLA